MDDVKGMLWAMRGEADTVECARCGERITFEQAVPEEAGEWECLPCWERCNAQERAEIERLSREGSRPCTCHPDDNPPKPCPQKYALQDCRAAAAKSSGGEGV